jgi:hypothetical protein
MRRRIAVLGILSFVAGCNPDLVKPGASSRNPAGVPPVPVYTLVGTIRGENDAPLWGATVTLTNSLQNRHEVFTDTAGRYEIRGISGAWNVVVKFANYVDAVSAIAMNSDRVLDIKLVPVRRPVSFDVGKEFATQVNADDSPCDPVHWDASAPCARLRLEALRTGVLTVTLTWESAGDVDFTIMSDDERSYLAYSGGGGHTLTSRLSVTAGMHYVIWVHSYYGAASFKIRADITP